jgi:uncharacterized membrane protein
MIEGTINRDDIIQVIIGASALTIPVAFYEEAWKLSRTLPTVNVRNTNITTTEGIRNFIQEGFLINKV